MRHPLTSLQNKIYFLRGQTVMLDSDLAALYGVPTKRLNEAVRRNSKRFPKDFMFLLSAKEFISLRSQFATLDARPSVRGTHRKYLPLVFTEQGVAMLSSVLSSEQAIRVNIAIMRLFVEIRRTLATHRDLADKLELLERKYDKRFRIVFEALKKLVTSPEHRPHPVGFRVK